MTAHKIAVLGGGRFGTVIASILGNNGNSVSMWLRSEKVAEMINSRRGNPDYLPGLALPDTVTATTSLSEAVEGAAGLFFATPSQSCRNVACDVANFLPPNAFVLSLSKGLEADTDSAHRFKRISEVLTEVLPGIEVGVMSGPNLATELAKEEYTATSIASTSRPLLEFCVEVLKCQYFRVYTSSDVEGVELGGALKNIYAIMGGMASEMKIGYNSISLLITRALAEMRRFAVACGASDQTFLGLAGIGDLLVTCLSPDSRNFQVGQALAQGRTLEQALETVDTAEGVNTLRIIHDARNNLNVYMPLLCGLYEIIYRQRNILEVVSELMISTVATEDVEFLINDAR